MASAYFYQLMGHVFVATHTAEHDEAVAKALSALGFGKDKIAAGAKLVERGEGLLRRLKVETPDNKTLEHNIHAAVNEVEMWVQAVKIKMRKADCSDDEIHAAVDHHLHAADHTVTGIAQTLRALGVLRTLDEPERFGSEQRLRDLVARGNTMVKKLYKVANPFVSPSSMVADDDPIMRDVDALMKDMSAWIADLDRAATGGDAHVEALGKAGYLPVGLGLPVGGNAFGVVLHQRAQHDAPDPDAAVRTSGWSVGRQGNRENLGEGWMPARTGSVMND